MTTPAAAITHLFAVPVPVLAWLASACPAMIDLLLRGLASAARDQLLAATRSRWGLTTYLGSRADWKPAL